MFDTMVSLQQLKFFQRSWVDVREKVIKQLLIQYLPKFGSALVHVVFFCEQFSMWKFPIFGGEHEQASSRVVDIVLICLPYRDSAACNITYETLLF